MATWERIALRAEDAYEQLKAEFEQYKKESIKWSVEDFTDFDNADVTKKEAQELLEEMIKAHDCNNGITWDDIFYKLHYAGKLHYADKLKI